MYCSPVAVRGGILGPLVPSASEMTARISWARLLVFTADSVN